LILDPFVGSGTTVVESQRLGRPSIGIDLNPIACLITKSKTLGLPAKTIAKLLASINEDATESLGNNLKGGPLRRTTPLIPQSVDGLKWYTTDVLNRLGILWRTICSYGGHKRLLAEAAFSAILLPLCKEERHWGYVCDNCTPRGNKGGEVLQTYTALLERIESAYMARDAERLSLPAPRERAPVQVICGDARDAVAELPNRSVKLILTSPPYFGVTDYVKSQRLSMEWYGYDIEPLRRREIGARSKRHRHSAAKEYLEDTMTVLAASKDRLRPDGYCVLVIGESTKREATLDGIRSALSALQFRLDFDITRTVSAQRRQNPSITGEHVIICRP
jgi:hypothetical protein